MVHLTDISRESRRLRVAFGAGLIVSLLMSRPSLCSGQAVSRLTGQTWNDSRTMEIVHRAVLARELARPDSTLASYRSRAQGFVFFLGQAGRELEGEPRLIKADQLEVEVYWRAPATSKQVILAWRDGRWLPTDVNYHRDHLGIVTNNFGDRIRIGGGDEVLDVPHPLAPEALEQYDYRLRDSVQLRARTGVLVVQEIEVRPRALDQPRVIGTLSLDAATGDLVRFRFSFTPSAYLDTTLEDISVTLENARVERWWLPVRQEIEIRRRVTWFDFPARSIIRGRWEIGDYELNPAIPPQVLRGPSIGGLRRPDPASSTWSAPLPELVRGVARPVEQEDIDQVRREIEQIVPGRMLSGLPKVRPGFSSVSDVAHVNRVQGLALGAGLGFRPSPEVTIRPRVSFGTSDQRFTGDLTASWTRRSSTVTLEGGRRITDFSDQQRISTLVNSLLAQEGGRDHGDYVLLDRVRLGWRQELSRILALGIGAAAERAHSVETEASPARGSYRPNPALGAGTLGVGQIRLDYHATGPDRSAGSRLTLALEGGTSGNSYGRATLTGLRLQPIGGVGLLVRGEAGVGTADLPRYRSFAVGGWGTLPGEPFRAFGGRRYFLGRLECRIPLPFPALPLGSFVSTGNRVTLAPFFAAGWSGGALADVPWQPSREVRPVAGAALEWLHGLVRIEAGAALRTGHWGVSVDLAEEWWDIL